MVPVVRRGGKAPHCLGATAQARQGMVSTCIFVVPSGSGSHHVAWARRGIMCVSSAQRAARSNAAEAGHSKALCTTAVCAELVGMECVPLL